MAAASATSGPYWAHRGRGFVWGWQTRRRAASGITIRRRFPISFSLGYVSSAGHRGWVFGPIRSSPNVWHHHFLSKKITSRGAQKHLQHSSGTKWSWYSFFLFSNSKHLHIFIFLLPTNNWIKSASLVKIFIFLNLHFIHRFSFRDITEQDLRFSKIELSAIDWTSSRKLD